MPSYNYTGSTASDGAHTHTVSDRYVQGGSDHAKANLGSHNYKNHTTTRTSSAGGHTHTVTIGSKEVELLLKIDQNIMHFVSL